MQDFWYPAGSAQAGNIIADQGTPTSNANAWPVKVTDGTDVVAVNADGSLNVNISGLANPLPVQDAAAEASLASIDAKLTNPLPVSGPLTDAQLRASAVPVSAAALPLPSGASTAANQATEIASLASIDGKLNSLGQKAMVASVPVAIASDQSSIPVTVASLPLPSGAATEATLASLNGKVTTVNTGAVVVSSSALPTGAAVAAKQAPSDITVNYDYRSISYVGATDAIDTIVYKTGGSGGTTVATQTFGYDGSNRLTSITTT